MELHEGLCQVHPDGVFQILETAELLAFQSTANLTAAMHLLGVAMTWDDEPVRLCTCPPTNTHLQGYVAVRDAHLWHPNANPRKGGDLPVSLPILKRGPCLLSKWPLGTLGMSS